METTVPAIAAFIACLCLPWGVFGFGLWLIVTEIRFRRGASEMTARLVEVSRRHSRPRCKGSNTPIYRPTFEIDTSVGPQRATTPYAASAYNFEIGQDVAVFLHPDHLGQNNLSIVRISTVWGFITPIIFIGTGFFFGVMGLALWVAL